MKRSEMIEVITNVLVFFRTHKCEFQEGQEDETKAVALLTALEEAGMLPPLIDSDEGLPYWNRRVWDYTEQKFIHRIPEWEPEE